MTREDLIDLIVESSQGEAGIALRKRMSGPTRGEALRRRLSGTTLSRAKKIMTDTERPLAHRRAAAGVSKAYQSRQLATYQRVSAPWQHRAMAKTKPVMGKSKWKKAMKRNFADASQMPPF